MSLTPTNTAPLPLAPGQQTWRTFTGHGNAVRWCAMYRSIFTANPDWQHHATLLGNTVFVWRTPEQHAGV